MSNSTQIGLLLTGSGTIPAHSNNYQNLSDLSQQQQEIIHRAKRYAVEQSIKCLLNRKSQPQTITDIQALSIMSRIYVGNLSQEVTEETISVAFSLVGAIKSIDMPYDQTIQQHRGFAFIRYEVPEAAIVAIENLNGLTLGSRQIKVSHPMNMHLTAQTNLRFQVQMKEKNRIYVSSIHHDISEEELESIFEPIGKIKLCNLAGPRLPSQSIHGGYGFIEFDTEASASEALICMNNIELGPMTLRVCKAITPSEFLLPNGTLVPIN